MRQILYSVLFAVVSLTAAVAETVDLGAYGKVSLDVPEGWTSEVQRHPAGVNFTVKPKGEVNAACKVTIMLLDGENDVPFAEMEKRWVGTLAPFAEGSVEKSAEPVKLHLKSGNGMYAVFTDASLVGKPVQPENYKVMAPGMIKLAKEVIVATTIFCDDKDGKEFADLVKMLESLSLDNTL